MGVRQLIDPPSRRVPGMTYFLKKGVAFLITDREIIVST
jgi:hypothetical protein